MHLIAELQNSEVQIDKTIRRNKYRSIVFNTSLSINNRTSKQKIGKDVEDLNNTINKIFLPGISRALHLETEYTFFFLQSHLEYFPR